MPVRRSRTDAGRACRLRKGEAARPLLGDEVERGPHQGFLQIAVMVAARWCLPAHVKDLYMTTRESSTGVADQLAAAAGPQIKATAPSASFSSSARDSPARERSASVCRTAPASFANMSGPAS